WSAAGPDSPKRAGYPAYVDRGSAESPRGVHAIRVLQNKKDFTIDSLIAAAYDSFLPEFDRLIPRLLDAYDKTPDGTAAKQQVVEQMALLRAWDRRWSVDSVPTSLAVYWGERLGMRPDGATPEQLLQALAAASEKLTADFGTWKTPWGEINRFQRIT